MTKAERESVYAEAFLKYGPRMQMIVAIEELSECQKELCKMLRKDTLELSRELAEEIADAQIILEQLVWFFRLEQTVECFANSKIQRLERRVRGKNERN